MPRASRSQAMAHRRDVLDLAAASVRERGVDATTVPELMAAAGLTHGGFYRHFASKEDLMVRACAAAYAEKIQEMDRIRADSADGPAARRLFLRRYLTREHRDRPGRGCGIVATAADVARAAPESPLRRVYREGIGTMLAKLAEFGGRPAGHDDEVLVELSVMAGALVLARATAGSDLSDRILDAARDFLLGQAHNTEPVVANCTQK